MVDYEIATETVEYVHFDEGKVTKENLVAHLSHYEVGDTFEVFQTGSLTDKIGKLLHSIGIVEELHGPVDDAPTMSMATERIGWKDPDGNARELYHELTVEEHTYKVRVGGRLKERHDTERDAVHAKAVFERRNQDARVEIETKTDRVMA